MQDFTGRVAVVTGAASGIGRGLAERCAKEGMRVVLADVEEGALNDAARALAASGAEVLAVPTDVSQRDAVHALARRTLDAFGAVHLLFNNAGVVAGSTIWESTDADWEWVLGVNLWGVIHGVRAFVPAMLAQDVEGHVVNTASVAGLLPAHPSASYQVTKHAVVALTEHLYCSLRQRGAKIGASVLCPGWVRTRILEAERNRPAHAQNAPQAPVDPALMAVLQQAWAKVQAGSDPAMVAEVVFQAIRDDRFYVFTDAESLPAVHQHVADLVAGRNPSAPSPA